MPKEYWAEPRARTKAKLDLLRNYLGAWFEILARATDEEGEHRYNELVYLDGFFIGGGSRAYMDIDQVVDPEGVEAMEIYNGASPIPTEFNRTGSGCGVIAFWTRFGA